MCLYCHRQHASTGTGQGKGRAHLYAVDSSAPWTSSMWSSEEMEGRNVGRMNWVADMLRKQ